ncbi:probable DEAD-box ATP-dependent RNA helicase 48 isoform X2 [Cynara cardunculus var. scolymus]|uniref:probable DEAD-box ATP-dependent RNA helicase 48 isoform X2 n=1 Tax=Cynara cardunculus var. scolymus TaxID=59895 RepID=UPI000D6263D0|nr:probable DEAD-box ATP-dependent RNA helicase 48 isoform X2 [Cynara cardunculus var. scolymus]
MYSSIIFLERSRMFDHNVLHRLTLLRHMGGGPRTFPGGLNKWQWKRLHEKQARQKEKRLLDQEKQLYQARVRSEIRSKIADDSLKHEQHTNSPNYKPLSPKEHIKVLADRFMKEGAEDLWNEADGPIRSFSPQEIARTESNHNPINLRRVISGQNHIASNQVGEVSSGFSYNQLKPRHFSMYLCSDNQYSLLRAKHYSVRTSRSSYRKNDSSSSEEDGTDNEEGFLMTKTKVGDLSRPRLSLIGSSDGEGSDDDDGKGNGKKTMMSSAALGKYDIKKTKRIPLKFLEEEDDLSLHIQAIRNEFNKRRMAEKDDGVGDEDSILCPKRFDECNVSPLTIKALTLAGYVQMTKVQDATMSACLEGKDALVKAKTGTGKSAAFLLPAIETVLKDSIKNAAQRVPQICVLILCPTRELASQIAAEANVLLKYHDGIGVQTLVGGTRFKVDQKRLETEPCQIIIATPGRLLDHIENKSGFSARLMRLKMLILDEADHLLDLGFRKDIEKIVDCLPRQKQSLLFSATLPKEVNQSYVIAPHEQHFQIVHHLLKEHIAQVPNYKVIVFCTTAMMTSLMFSLLREMKMSVREIHSRKPQLYRTRVSDEFKEARQLILITSEVSARGMNYPDVSLVIQVGVPTDREQYINRLGRTGREGKGGEGIMLLAPWEEYFLDEIKDLPLRKSSSPYLDPDIKVKIENSMAAIDPSVKEAAYHAWLGYYNSIREIGRDKTTLAELGTGFCKSIGLEKVPALFRKTAVKMGLKDIAGIRVRK